MSPFYLEMPIQISANAADVYFAQTRGFLSLKPISLFSLAKLLFIIFLADFLLFPSPLVTPSTIRVHIPAPGTRVLKDLKKNRSFGTFCKPTVGEFSSGLTSCIFLVKVGTLDRVLCSLFYSIWISGIFLNYWII